MKLAQCYALEITDHAAHAATKKHIRRNNRLVNDIFPPNTLSLDNETNCAYRNDLLTWRIHDNALRLFALARDHVITCQGLDDSGYYPQTTAQAVKSLVELAFKDWKLIKPGVDETTLPPTSYMVRRKEWGQSGRTGKEPKRTKREQEEQRQRDILIQHRYEKDFASEDEMKPALKLLKLLEPAFSSFLNAGHVEGSTILFYRSDVDGPGTSGGI